MCSLLFNQQRLSMTTQNTIKCHAIRPCIIVRAEFLLKPVEVQNALIRGLLGHDLQTANVLRMWQNEPLTRSELPAHPFSRSRPDSAGPRVSIDHNVEMPVHAPYWIHQRDEVL